jgi:hypothetical protein
MSYQTLSKIELKDLAILKKDATDSTGDDNLYYYKLGKRLGFVNQSGDPVGAATSVTLWYYRVPISGEELSATVEPIIDARWDNCLCYGACFDLTGDPKWLALFDKELDRIRTLELAQNDRGFQITSNEDYN